MSASLSSYQSSTSHLSVDRNGLLIVAGAASLSLLATLFLLLYVTVLSIVSKQKPGCTWASARLVFMQTSFGPIFLNLVFADMLLAIGLMHNFITFNERGAVTASVTCTSQGILIQLADVASALLNLLIAVETFIILSNGPILSWYTQFSTVAIWMLSCCFAVLGFLSFSSLELHSFYNWNGAWCWISPDYLTYQVTFHSEYGLTTKGRVTFYGALLFVLPPPSSPSTINSMSSCQSELTKTNKRQRVGSRGLRVVARTMLVYPITFVAYCIPLTVMSLIENHRRSTLSPVAALILSTLFALRGAIDVLAFGMTRNVFILRTPPAPMNDEEQLTPTSPQSFHKTRQISLDLHHQHDEKGVPRDSLDSRHAHLGVNPKYPLR
ncbi:hypothetical protein PCANC_12574 [Puccinia coronata f. sp. avenae]|uniref:G-protein coupled receptors family 1 profile domain-containing protein n=1 Tax=Puccinia coronata f. sp. avenae TaxID=200324 RepID=A0A2N5SZQ5_9BASI|nr:hypothetical protein PCANC_12574 [Puccinia coronata f. sp. avenae]